MPYLTNDVDTLSTLRGSPIAVRTVHAKAALWVSRWLSPASDS